MATPDRIKRLRAQRKKDRLCVQCGQPLPSKPVRVQPEEDFSIGFDLDATLKPAPDDDSSL